MIHKAVFIDRDGVICQNRDDYVKSWGEFEFVWKSLEAIVRLSSSDYLIVIVTNQSAIGRGIVSADVVDDINTRMTGEIIKAGGRVDRVIVCPHTPDDNCACRKPKPGMLLSAANEMDIDLSQSYMVGDSVDDMLAGIAAGCIPIIVLTGRGIHEWMNRRDLTFKVVSNLWKSVDYIVS